MYLFTVLTIAVATAIVSPSVNGQTIECVDLEVDYLDTKWTKPNQYLKYARTEADLPSPLNETITANGIFYLQGISAVATQSVSRPVETGARFIYLRYYAHHVSSGSENNYFVFPGLNVNQGRSFLNSTPDYEWKETFVPLDGAMPFPTSITVASSGTNSSDFLLIDQIIYVFGASVPDIGAIKALCDDQFNPTTTTTSTSTTEQVTESTTEEEESTTETETTVTATFPSTTTRSTTTTTTPAPLPSPIIEWIDVLSDYDDSEWSSASLRYAANADDLPELLKDNITGSGIFYFQGDSFRPNQATYRSAQAGNEGTAYLFLRYYVHHQSGLNEQQYYAFPALGKPLGVHYLDATADFQWKEVYLQLDTSGTFPVEVGISTRDPQDYLLIDRLIFLYRPVA